MLEKHSFTDHDLSCKEPKRRLHPKRIENRNPYWHSGYAPLLNSFSLSFDS